MPITAHPLTALQLDVLERLRMAGFPSIADCARSCWLLGKPCLQPLALQDAELLAEYQLANGGFAPRA